MWPCEQMAQVEPWLCRSCPLNTTNHLLHVIKISLTRVISHAFWQMWLSGCDMTQHCLLPPCAISLEASSLLLAPIFPCPGLPSSSPAPDGRHSGRTLAKADVFIFRRQNVVLLQMAVPWSKWQPLTLLPHSLGILTDSAGLLIVMGKLGKKYQDTELCGHFGALLNLESIFFSPPDLSQLVS